MERPAKRPFFRKKPLSEAGLADIDRAQQDQSGFVQHDRLRKRHQAEQNKTWAGAEEKGAKAYKAFLDELRAALGNSFNGYTGVEVERGESYNSYGNFPAVRALVPGGSKYPVDIASIYIPGSQRRSDRPEQPQLNVRNQWHVTRTLQISPSATATDVANMIKKYTRPYKTPIGAGSVDADAKSMVSRRLDAPTDYDRTARRAKERGIGVKEGRLSDKPHIRARIEKSKSERNAARAKGIEILPSVDGPYAYKKGRVSGRRGSAAYADATSS